MVATGAEPIVPPVPGLRELDGVWTNREVTGMTAVPRRLLVLGAGPVGVEMAQAVRRLGGEVTLVDMAPSTCSPTSRRRWARPSARSCAVTASSSCSACSATQAPPRRRRLRPRRSTTAPKLRGDRLLVATGRQPRVEGIGLETVGIEPDPEGIPVDAHLRAGDGLWAVGDVTGIWPLTTTGKYQGDIVAANILGEPREANYEALPRVVFTDPQAASVGATEARFAGTAPISGVARTATYTRAYADSNGFLTLLSDGDALTGAYALGPEAGEWLQQATWPSARGCRSTCCATPSSRSRPSPRSTPTRSRRCASEIAAG